MRAPSVSLTQCRRIEERRVALAVGERAPERHATADHGPVSPHGGVAEAEQPNIRPVRLLAELHKGALARGDVWDHLGAARALRGVWVRVSLEVAGAVEPDADGEAHHVTK